MADSAISFAFSGLGLLGALGLVLLPWQGWLLLVRRRIRQPVQLVPVDIAFAALILSAMGFALYVASDALPRVHRCLTDSFHCGGNRAGGMIHLATFGVSVAIVEVFWLIGWLYQKYARRGISDAGRGA